MTLALTLFVVLGFIFWLLAVIPNTGPWMERLARGFFLAAAVCWAVGQLP